MRLAFEIEGTTPAAVAELVAALFGRPHSDDHHLTALARRLKAPTDALRCALRAAGGSVNTDGAVNMTKAQKAAAESAANAELDTAVQQITETVGVIESATTLVNNIHTMIDAAVAEATANGATAAELAPVKAVAATLRERADGLAAAVAANSPPAPTPEPPA